ncbi:hypothetical protein N658DRAFT_396688, partial [Parathielavia hyrcaniae]
MGLTSPSHCAHPFVMIKPDNTLIQWTCYFCHCGPFWFIWECLYWRLYVSNT